MESKVCHKNSYEHNRRNGFFSLSHSDLEMKLSQKTIVLNYLKQRGEWVRSLELDGRQTDWGWLGSEASRRCRELHKSDLVEKERRGKYEYYRAKQSTLRQELHALLAARQPQSVQAKLSL